MTNHLSDSPFRDVREGRPWRYIEERDMAPEPRDRSWQATALGWGMLAFATILAPSTFRLLPMLVVLLTLNSTTDMYRDLARPVVILLVLAMLPMTLAIIMGIGLLRLEPWARKGALLALPCCLLLGGGMIGFMLWARLYPLTHGTTTWTDPRILLPFTAYAVTMLLLAAALIFGLTRKPVIEEFRARDI